MSADSNRILNFSEENGKNPSLFQYLVKCFWERSEDFYLEYAEFLIHKGADLNEENKIYPAVDRETETPLSLAITAGADYLDLVTLLVKKGVDLEKKNSHNETPLFIAIEHNRKDAVSVLLEGHANPNGCGDYGLTPLHYLARCQNIDLALAKLLVNSGAKVNAKNNSDITALHWAALHDNEELMTFLLEHGAEVNARDDRGQTPLHYLTGQGSKNGAEILVRHGADVKARDNEGITPLQQHGQKDKELVTFLLNQGAHIDEKDDKGQTRLHQLVSLRFKALVEFWLEMGANINARDNENKTPLHHALERNMFDREENAITELAQLLIDKGADIYAKTIEGCTPMDYATQRENREVIKMLRKVALDEIYELKTRQYDSFFQWLPKEMYEDVVEVMEGAQVEKIGFCRK